MDARIHFRANEESILFRVRNLPAGRQVGTGEKWSGTHFARPCHIFCEATAEVKMSKVYSSRREDPSIQTQKTPHFRVVFFIEYLKLAVTYSPSKEVPSVLAGLTSVFGMGTGVPPPLDHQL